MSKISKKTLAQPAFTKFVQKFNFFISEFLFAFFGLVRLDFKSATNWLEYVLPQKKYFETKKLLENSQNISKLRKITMVRMKIYMVVYTIGNLFFILTYGILFFIIIGLYFMVVFALIPTIIAKVFGYDWFIVVPIWK